MVLTSMIIVTIYIVHVAGIVGKRIRARAQVDSIQVTYRLEDGNTYTAPMRGGNGGTEYLFTIADGEKLTRMEGMTKGVVLDMLTFYSNLNNVYHTSSKNSA